MRSPLQPVPTGLRGRRLSMLAAGLVLYGFSDALLVRAGLGLDPWDVLHQGLARTLGGGVGTWSIVAGALVLLGWLPLRQRPGLGTVANVITIGTVLDLSVWLLPAPHALWLRIGLLVAGVGLNGLATGLYISAGLGPGPRDGLMTGLAGPRRSIRLVRTSIEATVLVAGWLLGGDVGYGTLLYALAIGPLAQFSLRLFRITGPATVSTAGTGDPDLADPDPGRVPHAPPAAVGPKL